MVLYSPLWKKTFKWRTERIVRSLASCGSTVTPLGAMIFAFHSWPFNASSYSFFLRSFSCFLGESFFSGLGFFCFDCFSVLGSKVGFLAELARFLGDTSDFFIVVPPSWQRAFSHFQYEWKRFWASLLSERAHPKAKWRQSGWDLIGTSVAPS